MNWVVERTSSGFNFAPEGEAFTHQALLKDHVTLTIKHLVRVIVAKDPTVTAIDCVNDREVSAKFAEYLQQALG